MLLTLIHNVNCTKPGDRKQPHQIMFLPGDEEREAAANLTSLLMAEAQAKRDARGDEVVRKPR